MTWSPEQKLSYLTRLPWTVTVDREEDGDFVASVAELPFIVATGADARAVARDLYDAVWTALEAMLEHQDRIPLPPDGELPWESGIAPTAPAPPRISIGGLVGDAWSPMISPQTESIVLV